MLDIVELSRLQFALTALYHFYFVPLTLGITFVLAIMETLYVVNGKEVYKDMTKFWGKLFLINFAIGVTTGITMEFQFGTNWSYYSHYVGDIFGAPLAIEGLMAFFLESTFVGLFFFGWDRLSKIQHLVSTYCVAFGSNFSAMWILIANGWMQDPVGSTFNVDKMRMELSSFSDLVFSEFAQFKFLHVVSAGYTTGSIFVLVISAIYLLKNRDVGFALRSFAVASVFGLCAVSSVVYAGDESGYHVYKAQPTKIAAIEGLYETEEAPNAFNVIAIPDSKEGRNLFTIQIPYVGGLIITRSLTKQIQGLNDIEKENIGKLVQGREALLDLAALRANPNATLEMKQEFADKGSKYLGYGLLLTQFLPNGDKALIDPIKYFSTLDEEDFNKAVLAASKETTPRVGALFYAFRMMVGSGFAMLLLFATCSFLVIRKKIKPGNGKLLKVVLLCFPLPWVGVETGWFVAEYGRQPWTVYEVLPTYLSHSLLSPADVLFSILLMCGLYTFFLLIEAYFMVKYAQLGPSALHTGKYHFEVIHKGGK